MQHDPLGITSSPKLLAAIADHSTQPVQGEIVIYGVLTEDLAVDGRLEEMFLSLPHLERVKQACRDRLGELVLLDEGDRLELCQPASLAFRLPLPEVGIEALA